MLSCRYLIIFLKISLLGRSGGAVGRSDPPAGVMTIPPGPPTAPGGPTGPGPGGPGGGAENKKKNIKTQNKKNGEKKLEAIYNHFNKQ